MTSNSWRELARNRLWHNNPGLVLLLGLCPLLAVSNSVVNALGLGLATLAVLSTSNLLVSLLHHQITSSIKLLVLVLLFAALTTCIELLMQAYTFKLYHNLGLFVPLIVTNCMLFDRAENFASSHPPLPALFEALMTGTGFMLLLLTLGAIREVLGTGALFANMDQLLPFAANWKVQVFHTNTPFLLAILPPGAFILLGLLIALKNAIDKHFAQSQPVESVTVGSKRVRVTGKIS